MTIDPLDGLPSDAPDRSDDEASRRFLEEVLVHFILRREEGEEPEIDAYLARYPRFAEDIAELLSSETVLPNGLIAPSTTTRERVRGWSMRSIGDYEIMFLVSSAGGGRVYKAKCKRDGRIVALKVLSAKESVDRREIDRFVREAELLTELDLPHVVRVIEVAEEKGIYYMAMPWIEGITLDEAIKLLRGEAAQSKLDPRRLGPAVRAGIVAVIARALHSIHGRGILHRDIKPSNIMLTTELSPLLIDFGIARDVERTQLTRTKDAPLGTPRFLAPELLMGDAKAASVRSEIYSLGVLLYECMTLERAFPGEDRRTLYQQILAGEPRAPRDIDQGLPRSLERLVAKAMDLRPERRFQDMESFAAAIDVVVEKMQRPPTLFGKMMRAIGLR